MPAPALTLGAKLQHNPLLIDMSMLVKDSSKSLISNVLTIRGAEAIPEAFFWPMEGKLAYTHESPSLFSSDTRQIISDQLSGTQGTVTPLLVSKSRDQF